MSEHFISFDDAESDLLSCAAYLAERIKSSDGHATAMAAVVPLYLKKGNVDLAAELANTVDDPFTRDKLLTLVAEKCAELDDDEYALQLADSIEDHGLRAEAFERVGLQKTAKGQFDKAHEIADQMQHPDNVLASIAAGEFVSGNEAGADDLLAEIEFPEARVTALIDIAVRKIEAGENEKAVQVVERAVDAAGDIGHNEEGIRALIDTGNAFVEARRNDKAVETFEKARQAAEELDNIHRDTFLALASLGFLHAGSLDLADRTLDQVTDKTQIASCLLGHSREFWKREEHNEAIEALEESYAILKSQRDIETRDSKARFRLFATIAAQFAGFEKGERAIEIAQNIEDENEQISGLTQVAEILTLRKEDEQARHALTAIADDASRAFTMIRMSDAKERIEDREGAISLLDEAAALAETVPQLSMRAATYSAIAARFANFGLNDKAVTAVNDSLQTSSSILDESSKVAALAALSDTVPENSTDRLHDQLSEIIRRVQ
jgi:tetratricopeptide (TPR) repeat protein